MQIQDAEQIYEIYSQWVVFFVHVQAVSQYALWFPPPFAHKTANIVLFEPLVV